MEQGRHLGTYQAEVGRNTAAQSWPERRSPAGHGTLPMSARQLRHGFTEQRAERQI